MLSNWEILLVIVPLGVIALQRLFNLRYGFENDLLTGGAGQDPRPLGEMLIANLPAKSGEILAFFGAIVGDFDRSRWLFALYLAALILARPRGLVQADALPGGRDRRRLDRVLPGLRDLLLRSELASRHLGHTHDGPAPRRDRSVPGLRPARCPLRLATRSLGNSHGS